MAKQIKKCFWLLFILIIPVLAGCARESAPPSLRIGIPHSDNIQNLESNYYLKWLEEQTGIDLIPVEIKQIRCDEYLEALSSSSTEIDLVMFGNSFVPSDDFLEKYAAQGHLHRLPDGTYSYLNYGTAKADGCGQVMWINTDWLSALSLEIPKTTDEFANVLRAFKENDPNGNGITDEIPLLGSRESPSLNPLYFLLNSFTCCSPYQNLYSVSGGHKSFIPETEEFISGTLYCRRLYEEGLIDDRIFTYSARQLSEIVNNPSNLVGAFTSASIGDVIYQGNPEIMARYICILPLEGQGGQRNAMFVSKKPQVGAVIIEGTGKEELCEKLLELMLTPEGSLIARFGRQNIDWEYSDGLDVSLYGEKALISTINYIRNRPQNMHLDGIGPMKVPEEYLSGVTWNGVNSDLEYIDARAQMNYMPYLPSEIAEDEYDSALIAAFEKEWTMLIKGEKEINEQVLSWNYLHNVSSTSSVSDILQ